MNDPYSVLGVSQTASDDEIKKAYRELARKYHPDNYQNNPLADLAEEKMKEVNEAYDALTKNRTSGGQSGYQQASRGGYQQGGSDPSLQRVRSLISAGNIVEAENLLGAIPNKSAEWYFLTGAVAYRKGWLDEALQNYNIASRMEPNNMEYRQAAMMAQGGGRSYQPQGYRRSGGMDTCDLCTTLMCLNCLCGGGC